MDHHRQTLDIGSLGVKSLWEHSDMRSESHLQCVRNNRIATEIGGMVILSPDIPYFGVRNLFGMFPFDLIALAPT